MLVVCLKLVIAEMPTDSAHNSRNLLPKPIHTEGGYVASYFYAGARNKKKIFLSAWAFKFSISFRAIGAAKKNLYSSCYRANSSF